jgi:hypothetical protein
MSMTQTVAMAGGFAASGLAIDLASDVTAKHGKVTIDRDVVLNATDVLKHVSSYYTTVNSNAAGRMLRQKHEWIILQSEMRKFYTVQKNPATGDVLVQVRSNLRSANDLGLRVAGQPTQSGEIRLHRPDHDFDLPNDLQVAYLIAWARKEDPRWACTTENSKHLTQRLRFALNDF